MMQVKNQKEIIEYSGPHQSTNNQQQNAEDDIFSPL